MDSVIRGVKPLGVATGVVCACVFAVTAVGIFDFFYHVAKLPFMLALVTPVGIDGMTLVAIFSSVKMRAGGYFRRERFFCWFVLIVSVVLSIGGNTFYGLSRYDLLPNGLPFAAVIGVGVWPIMLALSVHLFVITTRRKTSSAPIAVATHAVSIETDKKTNTPLTEKSKPVSLAKKTSRKAASTPQKKTAPGVRLVKNDSRRRTPNGSTEARRAEALSMLARGSTPEEVAASLGVSARTIYRYGERSTEEVAAS